MAALRRMLTGQAPARVREKEEKRSLHYRGNCLPAPATLGPNPGLGQTAARKLRELHGNRMNFLD